LASWSKIDRERSGLALHTRIREVATGLLDREREDRRLRLENDSTRGARGTISGEHASTPVVGWEGKLRPPALCLSPPRTLLPRGRPDVLPELLHVLFQLFGGNGCPFSKLTGPDRELLLHAHLGDSLLDIGTQHTGMRLDVLDQRRYSITWGSRHDHLLRVRLW
jgi:hypothetical protein